MATEELKEKADQISDTAFSLRRSLKEFEIAVAVMAQIVRQDIKQAQSVEHQRKNAHDC